MRMMRMIYHRPLAVKRPLVCTQVNGGLFQNRTSTALNVQAAEKSVLVQARPSRCTHFATNYNALSLAMHAL